MLHRVDPPEYVERLTGEVPDRGRKIRCPLPTHDERTPSFYVNPTPERGWHCFGCGADGDIYTLAGLLWGHGDHGRDWWNTHQRLVRIFL